MAKMPDVAEPAPKPIGNLKGRMVRMDDETWEAALAKAQANGLSMTDVVRHYLREYASA